MELWLSQSNYIEKLLDKFSMSKAKQVSTRLATHFKFSYD